MDKRRRDFFLSEEDVEYLDSLGYEWEAVKENEIGGVILREFSLPPPFSPERVDMLIKIPTDYATGAALDMFFTSAHVTRSDGQIIKALTQSADFDGQSWWQWSRHYPKNTKWRPGTDSLATHIAFVQDKLDQEANGKTWG